MALDADACPWEDSIQSRSSDVDTRRQWSNVGPLDRNAADAVGQWVDLLASLSHELRTPLNAVIGFSDAMQQEVFGPIGNARYREYVGHIRASGVELLHAAEDALAMTAALAQPKSPASVDVPLAALVTEIVEELSERDAGRRITFALEIPEDLEVRADKRMLARAIRQLLALAQSRAAAAARIRVVAQARHGQVEISVDVSATTPDCALGAEQQRRSSHFELGLGRRELALWLAVALLDLVDCRLEMDQQGETLSLRTVLEQCRQASFFPAGAISRA
jgi:light-regulated signal transduction histidine kinase (bacteriophytochrome)